MSGCDVPPAAATEIPGVERPDLRLLPLVTAVWVSLAAVLLVDPGQPVVAALVGGAVLGCGCAASVVWLRMRSRHGVSARRGGVVVLVLVGLGLGAIIGSLHLQRLHPPVLDAIAGQSAVIRASVRVTGDPQQYQPPDDGGRSLPATWSASARLHRVEVRGRRFTTSVPVVLRGDSVRDLRYGADVTLTGRTSPAWKPESHALAIRVLGPVRVRSPPGAVASLTTSIREAFRTACSGLPRDAASLLMGLAVGDESELPAELDEDMVRAGLSHLTAVSGSNTSLVAGIALAAVAALGLGWRMRVAGCLLVLGGYVALVRPQPSVLRAAAMGVVALLALSAGGRRRGPPALLAASLALLVTIPQFAVSLGFALSVAATAGLLLVGPPLAERLESWRLTRRVPEPVRLAVAVAAAAHLATLPLAILMGNGASLVALPANVVVTPLVPVATVLGLAAALLAPVWLAPAAVLAHVAAPATGAIAWVAHTAANTPHGVVEVPSGPLWSLGVALALGLVGLMAARGWRPWRHRRWVVGLAVTTLVAAAARAGWSERWPPPGWVVLVCDVGQGDGLILRQPGSSDALLVDAGPDPSSVQECLQDAGIRRLVVLISHFHADHVEGLGAVLAGWPVSAVLTTPVAEPPDGADLVLAAARQAGVPVRMLRAGDRLVAAGVVVRVLWPARALADSPANNGSLVALAEISGPDGPVRVLLTGDIEPEAQQAVMAAPSPRADVVKVPHHGSRYQDPQFAAWTGARIALVSVGRDNDYGHPSGTTTQQYRAAGALVGRTDVSGPLAVVMAGDRPALATQRRRARRTATRLRGPGSRRRGCDR